MLQVSDRMRAMGKLDTSASSPMKSLRTGGIGGGASCPPAVLFAARVPEPACLGSVIKTDLLVPAIKKGINEDVRTGAGESSSAWCMGGMAPF